eukprot:SAG31_NODE_95_length_25901_cov_24.763700_36_plen_98_part_00
MDWCLCSGNPDIVDAGNYESWLFPVSGYDQDLLTHVEEAGLVSMQTEVISCWNFKAMDQLLSHADLTELRNPGPHGGPVCIACPLGCWCVHTFQFPN